MKLIVASALSLGAIICLLCPPLLQAGDGLADEVIVSKTDRKLYLIEDDKIIRSYDIALGLMPEGHKVQEGDFKTPEGEYMLTRRRINSDFFMAIQISYPNAADRERARELGVPPGDHIMIVTEEQ